MSESVSELEIQVNILVARMEKMSQTATEDKLDAISAEAETLQNKIMKVAEKLDKMSEKLDNANVKAFQVYENKILESQKKQD